MPEVPEGDIRSGITVRHRVAYSGLREGDVYY